MRLVQMVDMWYNLNEYNHIESDRMLEASCRPFSKFCIGEPTMSHSISNPSEQPNIPYGYCQCGCGQLAPIANSSHASRGRVKGMPLRYIRGHNGRVRIPAPDGFKVCTRCLETKPLTKFYKFKSGPNSGRYRSHCTKCFQETWAQRYADPGKHQELISARQQWRAENKDRVKQIKKATEMRHPERNSARRAVRYQVSRGTFPPAWTMVCERCKEAQAAHWHHHNGYDKANRLNVIAVCVDCHTEEHRVEL